MDSDQGLITAAKGGRLNEIKAYLGSLSFPEKKVREAILNAALLAAAENGHASVTEILLVYHATVDTQNDVGDTPLHLAAREGHVSTVQLLLKYKAKPNSCNKYIETPLHCAAQAGFERVVKILLEHGAIVDAQDTRGYTPLHRATLYGNQKIVEILLANQANVGLPADCKGTTLHWAALGGHEAIAKLLLEKGAIVNAQDEIQKTPLHFAACDGHEAIVRLLLEKGAEVNAQDEMQQTPLYEAVAYGDETIIKILLAQGAKVNFQDKNKLTPLHEAVHYQQNAVIRMLLENGAKIDAQDNRGYTPLHSAAEQEDLSILEILMVNGNASLSIKDKHRKTPLGLLLEKLTFSLNEEKTGAQLCEINNGLVAIFDHLQKLTLHRWRDGEQQQLLNYITQFKEKARVYNSQSREGNQLISLDDLEAAQTRFYDTIRNQYLCSNASDKVIAYFLDQQSELCQHRLALSYLIGHCFKEDEAKKAPIIKLSPEIKALFLEQYIASINPNLFSMHAITIRHYQQLARTFFEVQKFRILSKRQEKEPSRFLYTRFDH